MSGKSGKVYWQLARPLSDKQIARQCKRHLVGKVLDGVGESAKVLVFGDYFLAVTDWARVRVQSGTQRIVGHRLEGVKIRGRVFLLRFDGGTVLSVSDGVGFGRVVSADDPSIELAEQAGRAACN